MRHGKCVLGLLLAQALFLGCALASEGWVKDFDEALTAAKKQGRPILLDISGSDWCGWCVRLDEEVFSRPAFKTWAAKKVVLCLLDFPRARGKVTDGQRKKNQAVKERLGAQGFPTVFLLTAGGEIIARTGYRPGGVEKYVEGLDRMLDFHAKNAGEIAALADRPPAQRATRAAALLAACPEEAQPLRLRLAEILFAADPENGTKHRPEAAYVLYELSPGQADAGEAYLRSIAKDDPRHLYQRLAVQRAEAEFRVLVQAYQGCRGPATRSPTVRGAAGAFAAMIERDLAYVDVKPYKAMMTLQRAVSLACAGRKAESRAAIAAAKALGAPPSMLSQFTRLAETVK